MWTYTGNPLTSPIDAVHYHLGDVEPSTPLASDEECTYALRMEGGNVYLAAAAIAETKALAFLRRPAMEKRGDHTISWAQQAEAFQMLATTLRRQASIRTTTVYAGGISQAEKDAARQATDTVHPFARTDLHDSARPLSFDREDW